MPRIRTYGLDVDTIAYAARVKAGSGVTILPENLKQINKFVIGVKKLGLWNSMVCWPMRSIHNAGRGSTVYSLGGLSGTNFNGTLTNQVAWDYNGLFWSVNGSFMQIANLKLSNVPCTILVVDNARTSGYSSNGYINHPLGRSAFFPGGNFEYLGYTPTNQQLNFGSSSFITSRFKMVSMTIDTNTSAKGYYNTTFRSVTNSNFNWDSFSTTNALRYTYSTSVTTQRWNTPFLMHSNIDFLPYYLNFYNLYRVTIGQNLDIPY